MSLAELAQIIGRTGQLDTNGLSVEVRIIDVKSAYGTTRYVVTPVAGTGEATVDASRVCVAS